MKSCGVGESWCDSWDRSELTITTFPTAARDHAVEKVNIDHINIKIIKGLFFQTYA